MQYMMLIYWDQEQDVDLTKGEIEVQYNAYRHYTANVRDQQRMVHAEALQPISVATTVRVKDGKVLATDGPFAETKEQLGGYYLLDCENLDEAIALAAQIPHAKHGCVEIRPVMKY